ncbi:hypothetical protein HYY75_06545, partial [bacterium]|nr:hypothetical protein [bacterium]
LIQQMQSMIDDMGGSSRVEVKLYAKVISAGAITSLKPNYPVVGVSIKAKKPHGVEAEFLDKIGNPPGGTHTIDGLQSSYALEYNLPKSPPDDRSTGITDTHDISGVGGEVKLKKDGKTKLHYEIEALGGLYSKSGDFDFDTILKGYVNLPPSSNFTLPEILKLSLESPFNGGANWRVQSFHSEAKTRFDTGLRSIKNLISPDYFSPEPLVVEKMGIIQLQATVKYKPHGASGEEIKRVLFADREFKVSDMQPPAPEYSFFVANSTLPGETAAEQTLLSNNSDLKFKLTDPIAWDAGLATISIHNIPKKTPTSSKGSYDAMTGFRVTSTPNLQLPGMIRINSSQKMEIDTFLGTADEPTLTEFNALLMEKCGPPTYNGIIHFQWKDKTPPRPFDFVLLNPSDLTPPPVKGLKALEELLAFATVLSGPVLLFGDGHFEYPLSLKAEAFLDMRYATFDFRVDPKGRAVTPKDKTVTEMEYRVKKVAYGLPGIPSHTGSAEWSPQDPENMPANLYSPLQYAKKANYFYENEAEFWADSERFVGGVYLASGVTYIKGDLTISNPFKVSGTGVLVAKERIEVSENITRNDSNTVFSLIARMGNIDIKSGCNLIQASCFSNFSPQNQAGNKVVIDGNLVVNQFHRETVESLEVQYNSAACRVSPMSVYRDVGKFEPKRYYVSLGKRWTRFEYQKN